MTLHRFGDDSVISPVSMERRAAIPGVARMSRLRARGGDGTALPVKAPLRCDDPGLSCDGKGAQGVLVHPFDQALVLRPNCFFRLQRRAELGSVSAR